MVTLDEIVHDIAAQMAAAGGRGDVAAYIPELAKVDPGKFGIAVITADGREYCAGDADETLSIQSISKIYTLTLALNQVGDALWERVGREPSGSAFNSIVQLEQERGIPRNPFINAGALVVSDVLGADAIHRVLAFVRALAGENIVVDEAVAASEATTGFRNIALANYMKAFGNLHGEVAATLDTYFKQCSISMTCRQLARSAHFLMAGGVDARGVVVVSPQRARRIAALMLTCGHYDASGDFAYRVGIPAKSGVGGGILGVVPGRATVAVWSPGLGPQGNSVLGTAALERLVAAMNWSVFTPDRP